MTNKQSANAKVAGDQSLDLESYIEAFESELSTHGDANVEDFVPHDAHPDYHEIVVELLRVDFEHRWQRGQLNDIDAYLEPFAATLSTEKRLEPLAFEAYRLNCQAGR